MESNQILDLNITDESSSGKIDIELVDGTKVLILSLVSFGLYGSGSINRGVSSKRKTALTLCP